MYKFTIKLLYNEWRKTFCTKTELLIFNINLPLAKLDIVGSKLILNGLIFSDDFPTEILITIATCKIRST